PAYEGHDTFLRRPPSPARATTVSSLSVPSPLSRKSSTNSAPTLPSSSNISTTIKGGTPTLVLEERATKIRTRRFRNRLSVPGCPGFKRSIGIHPEIFRIARSAGYLPPVGQR